MSGPTGGGQDEASAALCDDKPPVCLQLVDNCPLVHVGHKVSCFCTLEKVFLLVGVCGKDRSC